VPSAAVDRKIGSERRGDALKGSLGSGTEIEGSLVHLKLSAARRRRLGKRRARKKRPVLTTRGGERLGEPNDNRKRLGCAPKMENWRGG
jgi:hypothetical protein